MTTTRLSVSFPSQLLLDSFTDLPPEVDAFVWDFETDTDREHIDLVILPFVDPSKYVKVNRITTRLVQTQSIGYDHLIPILANQHVLANGATIHETATSEIAVALTLAAQRDLRKHIGNQRTGEWAQESSPGLADKRVLILGYGSIGKEIENRLLPFQVAEVVRVARSKRTVDGRKVHSLDQLAQLLPETDILIIATSLNESSEKLVNAAVLSALPDNALVVNIARGRVIDQPALEREIAAGRLRAALDVTDPEPLPVENPLWSSPNVIITPHVGGDSDALSPRRKALIWRQITHLLKGEQPENVVLDRRS